MTMHVNHHSSFSSRLNQLDVIADLVAIVVALVPGNLGLILDRQLRYLDFLSPRGDIVDLVRHVRPRRPTVDDFLDPDVNLAISGAKPEALTLEYVGARNFGHAQKVEIE